MDGVAWHGRPSSWAVRNALREAGFRIVDRASAFVHVHATAEPPPPTTVQPWIWLADATADAASLVEAVRKGAYDAFPLTDDAAGRLVDRLRELAQPEAEPPPTPGVIAESAAARAMLRRIFRAATSNMPVLLIGETGTGKEEMAGLIHLWSARRGPYLPINCGAIPNELMESELFGHAKGAFSGAVSSFDGKLMAAAGGTVFLDEIDDTPMPTQIKLLRVLEDGEVTRLGETKARQADLRVIAATNRDLIALIREDRFGQDLYERLAIVRIDLPPLRERREDVEPLTRHFLSRFAERQGAPQRVREIASETLATLQDYAWPGNIRELRNVVYQALVDKRGGDTLILSDVRRLLDPAPPPTANEAPVIDAAVLARLLDRGALNLRREVESLEATAVRLALARAAGSPSRAARLLGEVGRGESKDPSGTVRAMMRRLGIS
jgi:two-component system response regulator AtoC